MHVFFFCLLGLGAGINGAHKQGNQPDRDHDFRRSVFQFHEAGLRGAFPDVFTEQILKFHCITSKYKRFIESFARAGIR